MSKESLERRTLYRLAKVFYIGFYGLALLFVGLLSYTQKPQIVADSNKTVIVCSNNERHNAEKAGIYGFDLNMSKVKNLNLPSIGQITLNNNELNQSVAEKANKICLTSFMNSVPNFIVETDANSNKVLRDTKTGLIVSIDKQWLWNPQLDDWEAIKDPENGITYSKLITNDSKEIQQAKLFTIEAGYHTNGGWMQVIKWALVGLGSTMIVFEIIRRVFFYVAMGKSDPT